MNIYKLTRRLEFTNDIVFYTPEDPYRIYERLARIYLRANDKENIIESNTCVSPYPVFDNDKYLRDDMFFNALKPLHFLKWVLQAIPESFWKFNVYIDSNIEQLKKSAKEDKKDEIWVNIRGVPKKLKSVKFSLNVMADLKNKKTYLSSYEEIVKEVSRWGDYKYNYGNIKETYSIWKGGEVYD